MRIFFAVFVAATTVTSAAAETQMWVAVDGANRRTCPSTECGAVGKLFFREAATVYEIRSGWGRVSRYYDASCIGGRSQYVDAGPSDCASENGIVDGQLAEWIRLDLLAKARPADPGAGATGTEKLVAQSDDFHRYKAEFVKAAEALIASGHCTGRDFSDMGGFVKSTNKGAGIYFTYCADGSDRIYLDVRTGRTFR